MPQPQFSERQKLNVQWAHGHMGKRRFPERKKAVECLARMVGQGVLSKDEMIIYRCYWTNKFKIPAAGEKHYHVGHPNLDYMNEREGEGSEDADH